MNSTFSVDLFSRPFFCWPFQSTFSVDLFNRPLQSTFSVDFYESRPYFYLPELAKLSGKFLDNVAAAFYYVSINVAQMSRTNCTSTNVSFSNNLKHLDLFNKMWQHQFLNYLCLIWCWLRFPFGRLFPPTMSCQKSFSWCPPGKTNLLVRLG